MKLIDFYTREPLEGEVEPLLLATAKARKREKHPTMAINLAGTWVLFIHNYYGSEENKPVAVTVSDCAQEV